MRGIIAGHRASHMKSKTITSKYKRDVIKRVAVAFAQFVGPYDQRVIQHGSFLAGFGGGLQFLEEVSQFLRKPGIDTDKLIVCDSVFVGLVRKGVMSIVDIQPIHLRLADGFCVLQGSYASEVIDE